MNSLAEAHSAELRHLCLHVEHPIVLIKNCAASCQISTWLGAGEMALKFLRDLAKKYN